MHLQLTDVSPDRAVNTQHSPPKPDDVDRTQQDEEQGQLDP